MPKTILIAEDEVDLIKSMQAILESHGVTVQCAQNGLEAVELIEKSLPDVLILDLIMPLMDGYGVLEHLHNKGHAIPVIVLSNLSHEIDKKKCDAYGVRAYFTKSDTHLRDLWKEMEKYCL